MKKKKDITKVKPRGPQSMWTRAAAAKIQELIDKHEQKNIKGKKK